MLMLFGLVLIGVFQIVSQNVICKNLFQNKSDNLIHSLMAYIIAVVVSFAASGFKLGEISSFTVVDGIFYGICLSTELFCTLEAYKIGSMSLTYMAIIASIMIPVIPSWIFWGDPITVYQVVGMAVMFIAIALIVNVGKDVKKGSLSVKWFIYVFIAFLASGFAAICEKTLTISPYAEQSNEFILFGMFVGALLLGVFLLFNVKKEPITVKPTKKLAVAVILLGVCVWLVCILTVEILKVLPASVTFTINNGARLVIVTIIDVVFFKEELSKSQYVGLTLGLIAVLLLSV